ncbi:MAG: Npt1/Npt2 family nucleotide transporter [Chlamydiota bacterium]
MKSLSPTSKSSWAKKIWPVQRSELKKIVPLLILKFLISIIYSTLTQMKEPLIVPLKGSGAEVIPVIKAWVVFPLSILCAIGYSKLSNHFKRSTLFYGIVSLFLVFVCLYGFVLYPNADFFSPTQSADWLTAQLGPRHSNWVSIYRYWMHTLFFAVAELWGQVVILTLYWSFANHICQIKEAKRTYTLFIAAGNLGPTLAPLLILHHNRPDYTFTVHAMVSYILISGALILLTYWWMQRYVLTDKRYYNPAVTHHSVNEKTKLSLIKSLKHIFSSKYLLAIAATVISIALTINIVELTWKAHLKELHPDAFSYQHFFSKQTFWVGIVALITSLFFGSGILRRFGWRFSAQITPIAIGITSSIFFVLCIFKSHLSPLASFFGITPLVLIVLFGAFQAIVNKVTKYSFFDSTKEIVYIPLDQESKIKGKAAIEMVGSRLGKFGSSWIQLVVIEVIGIGTGSMLFASPYLFPIVFIVAIGWMYCIRYLNHELSAKEREISEKEAASKAEKQPGILTPVEENPA